MNQSRREFLKSSLAAASVPAAAALASPASGPPPDSNGEPDDDGREPNHPDLEELAVALFEALKRCELCLDETIQRGGEGLPEANLAGIAWNLHVALELIEGEFSCPVEELEKRRAVWAKRGY